MTGLREDLDLQRRITAALEDEPCQTSHELAQTLNEELADVSWEVVVMHHHGTIEPDRGRPTRYRIPEQTTGGAIHD